MEVKSIIFFFSSLFIFSCSLSTINNKEKPNIVFISIDDLNDWVGFLGYDDVFTPNMDRLAKNGFSFTNAHCPAPICGPSRTAILTGMRPVTSGVYDNNIKFSKDLPNVVTLTEHFRKNGYQVYGVGKLFHGGYPMFLGKLLMNTVEELALLHLFLPQICKIVNKTPAMKLQS